MGTTNPNYVQFIRGTPTAWKNLKKKNDDVLYFISEKDALTGQLYLGNKLISGGEGNISIDTNNLSLRALKDVSLAVTISDGSILMYDSQSQKWVNKDIPVMQGASNTSDGKSGSVPAPLAGQENYFLTGAGTWEDLGGTLEAYLITLYGVDDRTQSIREIASSETGKLLGENVPERYNTIGKIANWIIEKGTSLGDTDGIDRLNALERAVFGADRTSQTDGLEKDVKDIVKIIDGYNDGTTSYEGLRPVTNQLQGDVVTLQSAVSTLRNQYQSIDKTVTNLDSRLKWKEY